MVAHLGGAQRVPVAEERDPETHERGDETGKHPCREHDEQHQLAGLQPGVAVLGLQVVIEDYVGSRGLRLALLIGMKFTIVLAAAAAAIAVLRLALGVPA